MESADYWRGREDQIKANREQMDRGKIGVYVAMILILPIIVWIIPSYFEARTYSRLTGAKVTMWDAMWVDLRVQESIPGE